MTLTLADVIDSESTKMDPRYEDVRSIYLQFLMT